MNVLLVAALAAILSSLTIRKQEGKVSRRKSLKATLAYSVVAFLIISGWMFVFNPAVVGVLGGFCRIAALPILVGGIVLFLLRTFGGDDQWDADASLQLSKIAAVLLIGIYLWVAPMTSLCGDLYQIPQVEVDSNANLTESNFAPIDPQHMRVVDQNMAYTIGSRAISKSSLNLGSMYKVSVNDFSIQNVHEKIGGDKLYWVAPLQYQGVSQWMNIGHSPGFIMVDAENPNSRAQLHLGYNMRYLTSAYYMDDVIRHLYLNGYSNVCLEDINFEVSDDDLKPYWVVSLISPTVLNTGKVVKGVVIVDPESGAIKEYDIDKVPKWVDRVMPENLALDYLRWRGEYVHGWMNLLPIIGSMQDVNVPSTVNGKEKMWLIHGKDNSAYWFSGMTSHSSSDQALVANVMINSRTGKIHIYPMSGWNEQAVVDAVDNEDSVKNNQWRGSAPIPYDCMGNLTYVVPVSTDTSNGVIFKRIAIVDGNSGAVSMGDTREDAFEAFRQYRSKNGFDTTDMSGSSVYTNMQGIVGRMSDVMTSSEGSYRMFQLNGSSDIFQVGLTSCPEAGLTLSGDTVNISFGETHEPVVMVKRFDNLNVDSRAVSVNKTS